MFGSTNKPILFLIELIQLFDRKNFSSAIALDYIAAQFGSSKLKDALRDQMKPLEAKSLVEALSSSIKNN